MGLKRRLKTLVERATGAHMLRSLPRGVDLRYDIATALPRLGIEMVFDVGANVGQSAHRYLHWFPDAQVLCFEPARSTFERLQRKLGAEPKAQCLRLALGARSGSARMLVEPNSELSFIIGAAGSGAASAGAAVEEVEQTTLDDFCRERTIARIGLLKIDTEGAELDVLAGAAGMLNEQRIDLIQVEAGMNDANRRHVPLEALNARLQASGFRLFALYEQMHEWPTAEPHLRRVDAVFVSAPVISAHRG